MAIVELSDVAPSPPRADFAFEIDFQRGVGPASRVFLATANFIRACEAIDAELVTSIDASIETVLTLEDIQSGSIKTWLRSQLAATDDDALKKLDWKPLVGAYLVEAKYAILRWTDEGPLQKSLPDLRQEIQLIAAKTDVRYLPDYTAPSPAALTTAVKDFQAVKETLAPGDRARFLTSDSSYEMNLAIRFPIEDIEALAVARTIVAPSSEMILAVKKPDYLGTSKWELRHGKRAISAKIEDMEWLERFQSRQVDVRPGDALQCRVKVEMLYGYDNELIAERFTVERVLNVLANRYHAVQLPLDDPGRDQP